MIIPSEEKSPLEKKWGQTITLNERQIRVELLKAIQSSFETNYGFVLVKKDRSGGYHITHQQWPEVIEALKKIGAIGGYTKCY